MPYFKDQSGGLHFLDDAAFAHLLPVGCIEITDAEVAILQAPPPLTAADFEHALDAHLDATAQKYRWDNRFTFVARAAYPNAWQAQAVAFGEWMDGCNLQGYQLLEAVSAGTQSAPASIDAFLATLPEFVPPV